MEPRAEGEGLRGVDPKNEKRVGGCGGSSLDLSGSTRQKYKRRRGFDEPVAPARGAGLAHRHAVVSFGITVTGTGLCRTTRSVMLPSFHLSNPDRPWVAITSILTSSRPA
jgi:hypothetical protein